MTHLLLSFLHHYGYLAVALFMIAEGCGIPLPAGVMLVTAAAVAARGTLSIWGVALASTLGGIIGGSAGYAIGVYGGLPLVRRYGQHVGIDKSKLERTRRFFARRGFSAAVFGRLIPFSRPLVPMVAGTMEMSIWRFTAANALGSLVCAAFYGLLGYEFGRDLPALEHHVALATITLAVIAIVAGAVWYYRSRTHHART
jgi:membrane protein DedA with SNARE-associated domain